MGIRCLCFVVSDSSGAAHTARQRTVLPPVRVGLLLFTQLRQTFCHITAYVLPESFRIIPETLASLPEFLKSFLELAFVVKTYGRVQVAVSDCVRHFLLHKRLARAGVEPAKP